MKAYRGIVRGNSVILEEAPEGAEGAEAIVLLKVSEDEEREIMLRQKAMLQRGFAMGKLTYLRSNLDLRTYRRCFGSFDTAVV